MAITSTTKALPVLPLDDEVVLPGMIGRGTTGPGAALWVEAEIRPEPAIPGRARELAETYREIAIKILQQRGAFQVVDAVKQIRTRPRWPTRPATPVPDARAEAAAAGDDRRRRPARAAGRVGPQHLAELEVNESIRKDVNEGMEKQQREFLLRQQQEAIRKELAEIEGRPADESEDYRARVEAADLPEKVREAALKEVDKLERGSDQNPETAGSAPGWTPSSTCRGTSAPRTPTTWPAPAPCWTPTTPAWTT
jgi:ATP-dependent Lon protease